MYASCHHFRRGQPPSRARRRKSFRPPSPRGFGGAPRGTAVPLSSGRGVQGDQSPARFLWYRQRHLSFQRKVGLREHLQQEISVLRTIIAIRVLILRSFPVFRTLRGGTFDRTKVPKARWGVANAPQTPVARSLGAKTCGFLPCRGRQYPSFPCGGRGTRAFFAAGAGRGLSAEGAAAWGIPSSLNIDKVAGLGGAGHT